MSNIKVFACSEKDRGVEATKINDLPYYIYMNLKKKWLTFFDEERAKFKTYVKEKQDEIVTQISDGLELSRSNSATCSEVER